MTDEKTPPDAEPDAAESAATPDPDAAETPTESAPRRNSRWRALVVGLLITLGCLFAASAIFVSWMEDLVLDTDEWVQEVGPLIQEEEAVSLAVSTFLVDRLFADVDAEAKIEEALPEQVGFIAGPLSAEVRTLATEATQQFVESDAFRAIWDAGNRVAHTAFAAIVSGDVENIDVPVGEDVTIDLTEALPQIVDALGDTGIGIFGEEFQANAELVIAETEQLSEIQDAVGVLQRLDIVLPIIAFALLLAAVGISRARRRTVVAVGIGLAITGIIVFIGLKTAQSAFLDLIEDDAARDAASSVWDAASSGLRQLALFVLLVVGLVMALLFWLFGDAPWAVKFRGWVGKAEPHAPEGIAAKWGGFRAWTARHKTLLRLAGVVAVLIALAAWPALTWPTVVGAIALYLVYLGVLELLSPASVADTPPAEQTA